MNTVYLFVAVVVLALSASSQEESSAGRRPAVPTCVCRPCSEPSITHTNCERMGGRPVHSYCNCCDTCEILVGEGETCEVKLGQFPYPRCNSSDHLTCVNDVCKKSDN